MEGDVHANHNQEGSADLAYVGNGLENKAKSIPFEDRNITHNLERDQGLMTVTIRGVEQGISMGKRTRRWDVLPTWQFIGVLTLKSTRLRIVEIRRAARASE